MKGAVRRRRTSTGTAPRFNRLAKNIWFDYGLVPEKMNVLKTVIQLYQKWVSPWLPLACRFAPTCSTYAHQSLTKYPNGKGLLLILKRIGRCHPYCEGGIDPVP